MQRKIQLILRILLGALFTFGGVMFFFSTPPPLTGDMAIYFTGLQASKYFFYLLKITEIVCGVLLLTGLFVPLALVILAPIVINILMVHIFLEPSGFPMALIISVVVIYLSFFSPSYSPHVRKLFVMKA